MHRDADRAETLATLAIRSAPGVGTVLGNRLIRTFGSASDALAAAASELLAATEGLKPASADALADPAAREAAGRLLEDCAARGIRILVPGCAGYPPALLPFDDRPTVLFARGACVWPDRAVALVGTRQPSVTGLRAAREFAGFLAARGIAVVSGLARGIDTAAHQSALECGGVTIAVVGSGLDAIYPPENRDLARRIAENGGTVVSEYAPDEPASGHHFPVRNRVISALSAGTVVVEAPRRSGALGTADWAMEQGREVMAVPAGPYAVSARGCLDLIKQGAACVAEPEDVLSALGWSDGAAGTSAATLRVRPDAFGIECKRLLGAFAPGESATADDLAEKTGLPVASLLGFLAELELRGAVACLPGQRWCLR